LKTLFFSFIVVFVISTCEIKAQNGDANSVADVVNYSAKILDLIDNDIAIYIGDSAEKNSNNPLECVFISNTIFPEFDEGYVIEGKQVNINGKYEGEWFKTLNLQTNKTNLFLESVMKHLAVVGIPGYIKDDAGLLFLGRDESFRKGVVLYNQNKTNLFSLAQYADGNFRMTIMQVDFFVSKPYNSKKVGYTANDIPMQGYVIAPQFDTADLFNDDGLALVNVGGNKSKGKYNYHTRGVTGGKWAFINRKGNIVIPYTPCDYAIDFNEGYAYFVTKGVYTKIDKTGKVIKVDTKM
jgi:hypothetical protein